jgi:hypothetical protein
MTMPAYQGVDASIDARNAIVLVGGDKGSVCTQELTRRGAGWSAGEPVQIASGGLRGSLPSVCVDRRGARWVAYTIFGRDAISRLLVTRLAADGTSAAPSQMWPVTYGFGQAYKVLVGGPDGATCFHSGTTAHNSLKVYWSRFDGTRFPVPKTQAETTRAPGSFAALIDETGRTHLAWYEFGSRQPSVRYRSCDADGTWGDEIILANGRLSRPVLTTDGRAVWCFWAESAKGSQTRALVYRVRRGGAWGEPRTALTSAHAGFRAPTRLAANDEVVPLVGVRYVKDRGEAVIEYMGVSR